MAHLKLGEEPTGLIKEAERMLTLKSEWVRGKISSLNLGETRLCFTSTSLKTSYVSYPGGNIGRMAACSIINKLCTAGADPKAISIILYLTSGTTYSEVRKIVQGINKISVQTETPIAELSIKVLKWSNMYHCAGIGHAKTLLNNPLETGDVLIVSGTIGNHQASLQDKRIVSDVAPLLFEMISVRKHIKQAIMLDNGMKQGLLDMHVNGETNLVIDEKDIPIQEEVAGMRKRAYDLSSPGRMLCIAKKKNAFIVLERLRKYNITAGIIGEARKGEPGIYLKRNKQHLIRPL